MHPAFHELIAKERTRELQQLAAPRHPRRRPSTRSLRVTGERLALRLDRVNDHEALLRLAELEGRPLPEGRFVLGELDGTLVAALPLGAGPALADPFRPTTEILPLLALRAAQLTEPGGHGDLSGRAARWIASHV